MLGDASGAEVQVAPTKVVGATAIVPAQPDLDDLVGRLFGTTRLPSASSCRTASGVAGVGEAVGALIIAAGFRITLSQNAESFDQEVTQIVALGEDHLGDARRREPRWGWAASRCPR